MFNPIQIFRYLFDITVIASSMAILIYYFINLTSQISQLHRVSTLKALNADTDEQSTFSRFASTYLLNWFLLILQYAMFAYLRQYAMFAYLRWVKLFGFPPAVDKFIDASFSILFISSLLALSVNIVIDIIIAHIMLHNDNYIQSNKYVSFSWLTPIYSSSIVSWLLLEIYAFLNIDISKNLTVFLIISYFISMVVMQCIHNSTHKKYNALPAIIALLSIGLSKFAMQFIIVGTEVSFKYFYFFVMPFVILLLEIYHICLHKRYLFQGYSPTGMIKKYIYVDINGISKMQVSNIFYLALSIINAIATFIIILSSILCFAHVMSGNDIANYPPKNTITDTNTNNVITPIADKASVNTMALQDTTNPDTSGIEDPDTEAQGT